MLNFGKITGAPEDACAFCARRRREVAALINGPSVHICDGCVDLCGEILNERGIPRQPGARRGPARVEMPDGTVTNLETGETDPVATLVRNLRARCDDASRHDTHVVLPVELVRAIADGIEAVAKLPKELSAIEPAAIARDVERVVVRRLYRKAAKEHASAREAAAKLGASEDARREAEEYRDEPAPEPKGLGATATWLPAVLGGMALPIMGLAYQYAAEKMKTKP